MVLPVLILTVLSMILLMLFFFSCLQDQTELHRSMLAYSARCEKTFQIHRDSVRTSRHAGGIVDMLLRRDIEGRLYIIDEAGFIRAGDLLDLAE